MWLLPNDLVPVWHAHVQWTTLGVDVLPSLFMLFVTKSVRVENPNSHTVRELTAHVFDWHKGRPVSLETHVWWHKSDRGNCPRGLADSEYCPGIIIRLSASKKCIATLSLVKNSEDKNKVNYVMANPEDFKRMELSKWTEGRAAATECRTSCDPVTDRDFQPEKTRVCFASNSEEMTRTTFVLAEDICRTRVVGKVKAAEL